MPLCVLPASGHHVHTVEQAPVAGLDDTEETDGKAAYRGIRRVSSSIGLPLQSVLNKVGAAHSLLDTTTTILGILATVLTMLSYIEYTVLMLAGQICSIGLYIAMLGTNPEQLTYLIYSVYALICTTAAFVRTREIYRMQQKTSDEKGEMK